MISEHAVIDSSAKLASDVEVGPFTVIGKGVEIDSGCKIASHVVIKGPTKIGKNNQFYQFSSIGENCQDLKYAGEKTRLEIGDNNIFREGCSVHRGTIQDKGVTVIGSNNLFMVNTHVAHDCIIGNHVVFSNNASIAGHVTVGDRVNLGGFVGVRQFCTIGAYSFATGASIITKDIMPFIIASGHPAKAHGINIVGLERNGFTATAISLIRQIYKIVFQSSSTVKHAISQLSELNEQDPSVSLYIDFLQKSQLGILR